MRKSIIAAFIVILLSMPETAFAEFDPYGRWLLDGGGYAEKSFVRVELSANGELFVRTELEDGVRYVTGCDVTATLDASRFNINAWKYSSSTDLQHPVMVPEANPTLNEPFELPPVTYDGLTYEVTFTSASSGTIRIYGRVDAGVDINSTSVVWKEGTERPRVKDASSGCDTGGGAAALLLAAFVIVRAFKAQT
jgi:hypothetical protein